MLVASKIEAKHLYIKMMKKKLDMKKFENNINYGNPNTKLINCIVNNIFNVKSIVGSDSRLIDKTTNLK